MSNKLSLYIHYPFCKSKCIYCDFYSITEHNNLIGQYLDALKKEIIYYSKKFRNKYRISSIYIGGGTPSLLNSEQITFIFNTIKTFFNTDKVEEITIEVNPESLTDSLIKTYKKLEVSRISVGVQSFNNKVLKTINRLATKKIILEKLKLLRKYKFKNFSIDLIFGLPYQTLATLKNDLLTAVINRPRHISLYNLMIKEYLPIYKLLYSNPEIFPSEDTEYKMYQFACRFLALHGYRRYEISNFARKGYHSYHNLRYWLQKDYLGLGPAAVSTINNLRWKNVSDVFAYIIKLKEDLIPVENYEKIDNLKFINEKIMLSLRLRKGINLDVFKKETGIDFLYRKNDVIKELKKEKLIRVRKGHLYLRPKGIMVSNLVVSKLFF